MTSVPVAPEQKAQKQRSTLWRFLQYLKPHSSDLPLAIGAVTVGAVTQAVGPFLIGWSIDNLIRPGNLRGLMLMIAALTGIYCVGTFAIRTQIFRVGAIVQKVLAQLRLDIFTKIQRLSIGFFDQSESGDLMSRLLNDVSVVNQAFGQSIPQVLGNTFSLVGIIIAMLLINFQLGLLSNLVVPVMIATTSLFARWARARFRVTRETIGDLSARIEEDVSTVREAQAFNRVAFNIDAFESLNAANRDANVQAVAVTAAFLPSIDFLNTLATAGVLAYGGYLAVTGAATVGTVTAFCSMCSSFFAPFKFSASFIPRLSQRSRG